MREISMEDVKKTGCNTWSRKDNSVRGIETVGTGKLKVGDQIVIDNYFTLIVE